MKTQCLLLTVFFLCSCSPLQRSSHNLNLTAALDRLDNGDASVFASLIQEYSLDQLSDALAARPTEIPELCENPIQIPLSTPKGFYFIRWAYFTMDTTNRAHIFFEYISEESKQRQHGHYMIDDQKVTVSHIPIVEMKLANDISLGDARLFTGPNGVIYLLAKLSFGGTQSFSGTHKSEPFSKIAVFTWNPVQLNWSEGTLLPTKQRFTDLKAIVPNSAQQLRILVATSGMSLDSDSFLEEYVWSEQKKWDLQSRTLLPSVYHFYSFRFRDPETLVVKASERANRELRQVLTMKRQPSGWRIDEKALLEFSTPFESADAVQIESAASELLLLRADRDETRESFSETIFTLGENGEKRLLTTYRFPEASSLYRRSWQRLWRMHDSTALGVFSRAGSLYLLQAVGATSGAQVLSQADSLEVLQTAVEMYIVGNNAHLVWKTSRPLAARPTVNYHTLHYCKFSLPVDNWVPLDKLVWQTRSGLGLSQEDRRYIADGRWMSVEQRALESDKQKMHRILYALDSDVRQSGRILNELHLLLEKNPREFEAKRYLFNWLARNPEVFQRPRATTLGLWLSRHEIEAGETYFEGTNAEQNDIQQTVFRELIAWRTQFLEEKMQGGECCRKEAEASLANELTCLSSWTPLGDGSSRSDSPDSGFMQGLADLGGKVRSADDCNLGDENIYHTIHSIRWLKPDTVKVITNCEYRGAERCILTLKKQDDRWAVVNKVVRLIPELRGVEDSED